MIVVDASAVLEVLVGEPNEALVLRLARADALHAPHLLDTAVLHVLRRLEHRGELDPTQVESARLRFDKLAVDRYPHRPFSDRVWALRPALTAYDATYVALAEALGATLVTADHRLAAASGTGVTIEVH